jgi:hypothetical protein
MGWINHNNCVHKAVKIADAGVDVHNAFHFSKWYSSVTLALVLELASST